MEHLQAIFLVLLIGLAAIALVARDLMVTAIAFGAFSLFAATLYTLMGALDVAFVEAVIGGVTTVFYIAILFRTSRRASR